jgi:pyruvate dehydrogenase E2 component (dihydrolipoamide acetyltransferase)
MNLLLDPDLEPLTMAKEFKLPDLGEGVHEGQIIRLCVGEGDQVKEDQPLMEVETDKAAVEIPSPFTGTIAKWHVKEKQLVNVGDVMVTFAEAGEDASDGGASQRTGHATSTARAAAAGNGEARTSSSGGAVATATRPAGRRAPASPAVRKLARKLEVDLETVSGSGPGGRITRADVEAAAKGGVSAGMPARAQVSSETVAREPARATPQVAAAPAPPIRKVAELPEGKDEEDQYGAIRRVQITQARKTIANVMAESTRTIPHVTDADDADVTELERMRKGYMSQGLDESHPKLTLLPFVIRAVVRALKLYPEFNASFDHDKHEIIYRKYINVAVGVHTDRGLIAPVIRDADKLGITELANALGEIAHKARTASFAVIDTRGGTYTISNVGAFGGSRYSTPIITPPQVAVLALGRTRWMPWIVDSELKPRLIMPLSHSFDHRVTDGGPEVQFMQHIIADLENPGRMLL